MILDGQKAHDSSWNQQSIPDCGVEINEIVHVLPP